MDASEQIRRSSNQDERECSNRGCPLAIRCVGNDEYVERTGIVEETIHDGRLCGRSVSSRISASVE
jgi:hypothetical protein